MVINKVSNNLFIISELINSRLIMSVRPIKQCKVAVCVSVGMVVRDAAINCRGLSAGTWMTSCGSYTCTCSEP